MKNEIYIDSLFKSVDKLGMQKIRIHKEGRPHGRGNENINIGSDDASWQADYKAYRESICGVAPTDALVLTQDTVSFNGQRVRPAFMEFMDMCFPYHLEARFGDVLMSDGDRLEIFTIFVAKLNKLYAETLKSAKVEDPLGLNAEREYKMVRAFLFNEFVRFDEQPHLHVLFSLAPTHLLEMLDELGAQLELFADQRCLDCIPFMQVNRVKNQAGLMCRLLGFHKDRTCREFPVIV